MLKKAKITAAVMLFVLIAITVFSACSDEHTVEEWGSFTGDKTYSYDGKYTAVQVAEKVDGINKINVQIFDSSSNELIDEFIPARASDFWGICWESDSYNIWIQSGDIGVYCYKYQAGKWILDETAERPTNIVSKYD